MLTKENRPNIKNTRHKTCKNFSIVNLLRKQNKSNEYFETMLSNIAFEDLVALKLELTYRSIGVAFYGAPLWRSMHHIIREGLLKYAVSISKSKGEAARYLGVDRLKFFSLLKKYNINYYFTRDNPYVDNRTAVKEDFY